MRRRTATANNVNPTIHIMLYAQAAPVAPYLRASNQVTAGPEPLVAYLLSVEQEIRSIRLIFSAKQVNLASDTIQDRLALSFAT